MGEAHLEETPFDAKVNLSAISAKSRLISPFSGGLEVLRSGTPRGLALTTNTEFRRETSMPRF